MQNYLVLNHFYQFIYSLHRVVKIKLLERSKVLNIFLTGECLNMDAYTFYCRIIIGGESCDSTEFIRVKRPWRSPIHTLHGDTAHTY